MFKKLLSFVVLAVAVAYPQTKPVEIVDPVLNMRAFSLTIPSNWIFTGAVFPGSSCNEGPFPVFRLSSPDGLTGIKQLPRLDWTWSEKSARPEQPHPDCLQYDRETPASEILKYMVGVLQVEFVKFEPTPDLATIQKNTAARSTRGLLFTADKARATVRYHINNITIEERLNVFVGCGVLKSTGQHSCNAGVTRTWAPQGKYSDETFRPISTTFAVDQQWSATRARTAIQKLKDLSDRELAMIRQQGAEAERRSKAQFNAFNEAQSMRQRQHEQFLDTLQRGTDMSMKQAAASANANHRAASDWCDYSLDLQKRLDPNTGLITKDSSAYSYTWVNQSGDRVQTNDINANPNGNGTGNWTLQQNVR